MPLEFLNVPNNMAGFYVAQGLGLQSANLTIAHRAFPFETALDIAIFRLASSGKKNSRALVGGVEECAYPLDQHRQRMQLAMDTPLAEGSSWLYLGNTEMDNEELGIEGLGNEAQSNEKLDDEAQGNEEPANKQHALARCEWVKFFPEHDALLAFLQGLGLPSSTFLAGGYGLEEEQLNALATTLGIVNRYNGRSATPYHDTQCAYVIASFISEQQGQCLVYVNRDARDCYAGVCISTLAQE